MQIDQPANPDLEIDLQDEPSPEEIANDAALELVKRDAETAEAWIAGNQWNERWDEIDILYDSPRVFKTWEQVTVMQPNVQRYIISRHVNSIHPAMMEGIFSDTPPFFAEKRPGTSDDVVKARSTVIQYQLDDMEFKNEVSNGCFQDILHGTAIWKWGLHWVEVPDYAYERKSQPLTTKGPMGESIQVNSSDSDEFIEKPQTKRVLKPFFEHRELRSILVDSSLRVSDIRKAKFAIDKDYVTLADLLDMKDDPNYTLPSEEVIRSWFEKPKEEPEVQGNLDSTGGGAPSIAGQGEPGWKETTEDPSLQGLLRLERWDKYKVITTINNKVVIQNKPNPYGVLPYFSCNWFNRIRAFYGLGVGKIIAQDQRLNQGVTNSGLALLQILLDPPFAVDEDSNVATQNQRFRKGGFIKVKTKGNQSVSDAIKPLELPRLPVAEIMAFLQSSESEAEAADGANALTMQGSVPSGSGKTSITRTAGGVNAFQGATASRLQGPVDRFLDQVFIPWIFQLDELNRRFLPMNQVRDILGDELGSAFKVDELAFKTGRMKFTALAGTRMAAKRIMAQSLPIMTQLFLQPAFSDQLKIQNKYFDMLQIAKMWFQASGWPNQNDVIKDMTPEMQQNVQNFDPGMQKAKAAAAQQQQKTQDSKDLLAQKGEQGIARDAIKMAMQSGLEHELRAVDERATEPFLESGEPGGNFGVQ